MKTLSAATKSIRKPGPSARKAGAAPRSAKWVVCGSDRRMSREEILASDAAFLEKMRLGAKATKSSVELVRQGR